MVMSSYFYLAIAVILGLSFTSALADDKVCSIARHGTVTMFTGEMLDVTLPCKYRLADVTCGDYRVKVTPGSAVDSDGNNLFSPSTLWVKVVNTQTEDDLTIKTSLSKIKKYKAGKTDSPWVRKEGSVDVVQFAGYDSSRGAAVLETSGVFSVEFSDAQHSVLVRCSSEQFSSPPLPDTLCGDATTPNAMDSVTSTLFPGSDDVTTNAVVNHIVLNDDTVVQSRMCKGIASKFQGCEDKQDAAEQCQNIFGQSSQAQCLAQSATPLKDYYNDCLSSVCDGDASALNAMNQFIRDNCDSGVCGKDGEEWLQSECESDSDCDVDNSQCIGNECQCAVGYFYSESTKCCLDTCEEFFDGEGYEGFVEYHSAKLNCGLPNLQTNAYSTEDNKVFYCLRNCLAMEDCRAVAERKIDKPWATYECDLCQLGSEGYNVTLTSNPSDTYLQKKCV